LTDKAEHPPLPEAFAQLGVRTSLLRGLADAQFTTPSEIQTLLIPRALAGVDILGQARTGTGKTAAFAIPLLQQATRGVSTQAIILVPTRELAVQVDAEIKRLAQFTPIRTLAVYGGQKIAAQMKFLKHHPEILVGTPGRVIDLLDRRIINFDNVRFAVLDEVDRMLDIGFRDDIRNILSRIRKTTRATPASTAAPQEHGNGDIGLASAAQTIFVSATISPEIEKLARQYMREPVEKLIAPGADDKPTVESVEQYYLSAQPWDKYRLLRMLLMREQPELAIVFCRTKHGAHKIARRLHADGIECREIHGDLIQSKRESVMKSFRHGKFDVLVATDLASRGIDVADISHIINFDLPDDPEAYVHRVGRTARMGAAGKAFTLVEREQGELLTRIEVIINMVIPQARIEGFEPSPPPADWTEHKPQHAPPQRDTGPVTRTISLPGEVGRTVTLTAPPRTLGSKKPLARRKKHRR
jgi:ATP-dependent RNA helicase DeaD